MKNSILKCLTLLLVWNIWILVVYIMGGFSNADLQGMTALTLIAASVNLVLLMMIMFFELDREIWLKQMFCKHTKIIVDTKNKTAQCARCGKYHLLQSHE